MEFSGERPGKPRPRVSRAAARRRATPRLLRVGNGAASRPTSGTAPDVRAAAQNGLGGAESRGGAGRARRRRAGLGEAAPLGVKQGRWSYLHSLI